MNITRISSLDMYYLAPMALSVIKDHIDLLTPYMRTRYGADWYLVSKQKTTEYIEAVDTLIRERTETRKSINELQQLMVDVQVWRRTMESMAREAPPSKRPPMLRAVGRGLGSPRSVKEMKDFLTEVGGRLDVYADDFRQLGAVERALSFARDVLARLQQKSTEVAHERGEDDGSREQVRFQKQQLIELFSALDNAATAAAGQARLFDHGDSDQAFLVDAMLDRALGEARVHSRSRAAKKDVPSELTEDSESDAEGEVSEATPVANAAASDGGSGNEVSAHG